MKSGADCDGGYFGFVVIEMALVDVYTFHVSRK